MNGRIVERALMTVFGLCLALFGFLGKDIYRLSHANDKMIAARGPIIAQAERAVENQHEIQTDLQVLRQEVKGLTEKVDESQERNDSAHDAQDEQLKQILREVRK